MIHVSSGKRTQNCKRRLLRPLLTWRTLAYEIPTSSGTGRFKVFHSGAPINRRLANDQARSGGVGAFVLSLVVWVSFTWRGYNRAKWWATLNLYRHSLI